MNFISRTNKIPLYHQLYQMLLYQIRNSTVQPDDMLPSEAELMETYDLSRSTVRLGRHGTTWLETGNKGIVV